MEPESYALSLSARKIMSPHLTPKLDPFDCEEFIFLGKAMLKRRTENEEQGCSYCTDTSADLADHAILDLWRMSDLAAALKTNYGRNPDQVEEASKVTNPFVVGLRHAEQYG
jgi:hypothetical protein